jgi:hypothetical protein
MAIILDAKFPGCDCADALRVDLVLCRNFIDSGKRSGRKRYDGAGAAFAE